MPKGESVEFNDVELKQVIDMIRLAIPVETIVDLGFVYNNDFFKGKKPNSMQYYYYMLLKRRGFFKLEIDSYVLTQKRLKDYVLRLLIAEDLDNGLFQKTISNKYHISQSLVSIVKRDYTRRTQRRVPNIPQQLEDIIQRNINIMTCYNNYGLEQTKNQFNELSLYDIKLIIMAYKEIFSLL